MLDDHSAIQASKSHAELVEADFRALSGRIREKSSFDGLRVISRYVRLANL